MKKGLLLKTFIYFLSISFLLLTNGFPQLMAEASGKSLPLGEMVSKGEVTFEAKENVWKKVEASLFPVFQGVRIKTGNGMGSIALADDTRIELGQHSVFSLEQPDRIHLTQGTINFRIPSSNGMAFRVGNVSIVKSHTLQAARGSLSAVQKQEDSIGSISIHPNGSLTVKSIQGSLSILDQDRVVLAALSSKDSVTLPSVTVKTAPKVMVAQVGETGKRDTSSSGDFWGLSTWTWVGIGVGAVVVTAVVIGLAGGGGGGGGGGFICIP